MTDMVPLTDPSLSTFKTWDGSVVPGTISAIADGVSTLHVWKADAEGTYHTDATALTIEWLTNYQIMQDGHGDMLTAMQRMEGNAEAVFKNTGVQNLSEKKVEQFREDTQKEYDAIDAAMRIDQVEYGIDIKMQFNTYTYQKMEQTLQADEKLLELGYQGHGTNNPIAEKYEGYTTDFQNRTDNKTYFVGGGSDNGEKAIAAFYDDVILTHAPFPIVAQNGHLEQLNQNGDPEDTLQTVVSAANESAYTRVFVASDFSTDKTAVGEVRLVPNPAATPELPKAGAGQTTTLDGSVISDTINITPHIWKTNAIGLFTTTTDLAKEWKADLALMQSGAKLTQLQRWEANAEAVLENTAAKNFKPAKLNEFRADTQREFDAVWAAMEINQRTLGIPTSAAFTDHTYLMMEHTLRANEQLEELGIQGHGLNGHVAEKYEGYTQDFQNRTDNRTLYVGPGLDHGERAIAAFYDDVILSHAPFPTLLHNGKLIQLNQNGNREDSLANVVGAANDVMFTMSLHASDFSHPAHKTPPKVNTKKA